MKINLKDKTTITLGIILGIVSIFTLIIGYFYLTLDSSIIIPDDFTGKNVQEVIQWAKENQFSEQIEYIYEYDEKIEKDIILSQSLKKEETLKEKEKFVVTVSKGADPNLTIQLVDFSTMNEDEIKTFFDENQFSDVTFEYVASQEIAKGGFIKANVEKEAKRSDLIVITISLGNEDINVSITVPDFSEYTKANIQAWAKTNGIQVIFKTKDSNTIKEGNVLSQSIKAGETISTGDSITITLSSGKNAIELPNLADKTKDEVVAWAKENNAKVEYISYHSDKTKKDYVISTTPKSGTVSSSTTIKIYISLGSIQIPDFTNKKEADVKKWIDETNKNIYDKNNYISYKIVEDTTSSNKADTIIKTDPAKDKTLQLAGTLKVTIAKTKEVTVASKTNISVSELEAYLKELDMKLGQKVNEVYSDKVTKGNVVRHDSGKIAITTPINYTLSLGNYNPVAADFNGKTTSTIQSILKTANDKEAGNWKLTTKEVYSNTVEKGKTFDCTINTVNKEIQCSVSKSAGVTVKNYVGSNKPCSIDSCNQDDLKIKQVYEESTKPVGTVIRQSIQEKTVVDKNTEITLTISKVKVENKANTSEKDFEAYLKGLGMSLGTKTSQFSDTVASGNIISNDAGSYTSSKAINYIVSKGSFSPASQYVDLNACKADIAQTGVSGWSCERKEEFSDTVASGSLIRQDVSGKTITLVYSKGKDGSVATIPNYLLSSLGKSTWDETVNNVSKVFSDFTNLKFVEFKVPSEDSRPSFMVLSISEAAGTKNVPIDKEIIIEILVKE